MKIQNIIIELINSFCLFNKAKILLSRGVYKFTGNYFKNKREKQDIKGRKLFHLLFYININLKKTLELPYIEVFKQSISGPKIIFKYENTLFIFGKIKKDSFQLCPYEIPKTTIHKHYIEQEYLSNSNSVKTKEAILFLASAYENLSLTKYRTKVIENTYKILGKNIELTVPPMIQHGDFHDENLVKYMNKIYVIDLDYLGVYPVFYDLINLLVLENDSSYNLDNFIKGKFNFILNNFCIKNNLKNTVEWRINLFCCWALGRYFGMEMYGKKTKNALYNKNYVKKVVKRYNFKTETFDRLLLFLELK